MPRKGERICRTVQIFRPQLTSGVWRTPPRKMTATKADAAFLLSDTYARRQAQLDFVSSGDANLPPASDSVPAALDRATLCARCEEAF